MRRTKITFILGELIYYLFKRFLSFSLAQIRRHILENQLALSKFGRRLGYPENDVNSAA